MPFWTINGRLPVRAEIPLIPVNKPNAGVSRGKPSKRTNNGDITAIQAPKRGSHIRDKFLKRQYKYSG